MSSTPPTPPTSAPIPRDLIACRPGCFDPFQAEAFALMAECGIHHVELESVPTPGEWRQIQAELARHHIAVSSISSHVNFSEPATVEEMVHAIDAAPDFGAHLIFSSIQTGGASFDLACRELRRLGDHAARRGIVIAMETHPDLATNGRRAATTMLAVDHPHIRLNYDSANIFYHNEHCNGIAELLYFLPWLGAVHLKESNGRYHDWWFPGLHEPGGIVDFPRLFALCHAADFHGPFTLEIEGITGETVTRDMALSRIRRSMDYLRSINPLI